MSITINFHKQFPLAPNVKELNVFESHEFELISPLPNTLENYASSEKSIVQAIKVCGKEQYDDHSGLWLLLLSGGDSDHGLFGVCCC